MRRSSPRAFFRFFALVANEFDSSSRNSRRCSDAASSLNDRMFFLVILAADAANHRSAFSVNGPGARRFSAATLVSSFAALCVLSVIGRRERLGDRNFGLPNPDEDRAGRMSSSGSNLPASLEASNAQAGRGLVMPG